MKSSLLPNYHPKSKTLMKKLCFTLGLFFCSYQLMAQPPATTAAGYYFATAPNYPLADIHDGTQVIGPNQELVATITLDMGFNFNFAGTNYDHFSVSSSGTFGLGNTPVSPIFYEPGPGPLSSFYVFPVFSPWSDELTTANNGGVSYKILTVNNLKKLVIEWRVRSSEDQSTPNYNKTFQVWLSEGSDRIQYVYGTSPTRDENSFVAIAKSVTDYLTVNASNHTVQNTSNNTWPGAGRTYVFSASAISPLPAPIYVQGGTITNTNCFGAANGSISIGTISGGDGNYTINWNGPNGFTASGSTISNLSPGDYYFTITDGIVMIH